MRTAFAEIRDCRKIILGGPGGGKTLPSIIHFVWTLNLNMKTMHHPPTNAIHRYYTEWTLKLFKLTYLSFQMSIVNLTLYCRLHYVLSLNNTFKGPLHMYISGYIYIYKFSNLRLTCFYLNSIITTLKSSLNKNLSMRDYDVTSEHKMSSPSL